MKHLLKRLLLILSSPLRYAIRYELIRTTSCAEDIQDIGRILQRRAAESSAEYVAKNMFGVDSVNSNQDLLTLAVEHSDLEAHGLICEFGVFSGNTIRHLAALTTRTVYGFDSFEGLPEWWRDGFGKGHFELTSLPTVPKNVSLVKGWFDETLPKFAKDHEESLGFLHIDCDLYSSTCTIFANLGDRIGPGCVIVFDEYFNYPGWEDGEYKAFQEFIERAGLNYSYTGYNRLHEQVALKIVS